jgi:hypothetical protein
MLECKVCGHQESPIKGTAFENSKLPLVKLFLACFFIAETKSSISAVALAQYISVSIKTARNLLRKFRTIMIEADHITSYLIKSFWMKGFSALRRAVKEDGDSKD